jgi:hypothetical protein
MNAHDHDRDFEYDPLDDLPSDVEMSALDDTSGAELVQWYDRPGWPFGQVPPTLAIAGAFSLGLVLGAGVISLIGWARGDHDDEA